jgi:hypothetical protein
MSKLASPLFNSDNQKKNGGTHRYPLIVSFPQTSKSPCTSSVPLILSLPKILTLSLLDRQ